MLLGKSRPKLALSFTTRRLRLGVAHHGVPSAWSAPTKDVPAERSKPHRKKR
jgi:hypothetical protein